MTEYELFIDHSYYDMWCVRPVGSTSWYDAQHFVSKEEAEAYKKAMEDHDD